MRACLRLVCVAIIAGVAFCSGKFLAGAPAASESPETTLEQQLANAKFKLAEANLERALQMNRRVGNLVPADIVREYQQAVEVAKVRIAQAALADDSRRFAVWLRQAEGFQVIAEAAYRNAIAANERTSRAVTEAEVTRLHLKADVAQLQLQRGRSLIDRPSALQNQWQLDLLDDEVQQLREEIMRRPNTQLIYTP